MALTLIHPARVMTARTVAVMLGRGTIDADQSDSTVRWLRKVVMAEEMERPESLSQAVDSRRRV